MKLLKIFIPGTSLDLKTNQLLKEFKPAHSDEECKVQIERIVRKYDDDYDFLLTDSEIVRMLEKLPKAHVGGLQKIIIETPSKNEHHKLLGRYEKGIKIGGKYQNGRVHLFKHLKKGGLFEINLGLQPNDSYEIKKFTPEQFKLKNYLTLLHEIGHHVGIKYLDDETEVFAKEYVENYSVMIDNSL
ncbi:hypothetical protein FJZ53_02255 [Candidatus Woesearchaeota archaeon]|nr:hypothetical protein [Candidatus Woesearchaeota archaeon]